MSGKADNTCTKDSCVDMADIVVGTPHHGLYETPKLSSQSSKRKAATAVSPTEADEPLPKLSNSDRLAMFGGDCELLSYYSSLREAVATVRRGGRESLCDPQDAALCERLEREGWKPRLSLKDVGDGSSMTSVTHASGGGGVLSGASSLAGKDQTGNNRTAGRGGFSYRQTALDLDDQKREGVEEDNDDDGDGKADDSGSNKENSFVCGAQGCNIEFSSLASYESHYHTSHHFVCHVCRRVFVSNFLLDVHLEENHDSYFNVLSPKIDMYRCLVENCSLKFRTSDIRKEHLISVHRFPPSFSLHKPIKEKSHKGKPDKAKPCGDCSTTSTTTNTGNNKKKRNRARNNKNNSIVSDSNCDVEDTNTLTQLDPFRTLTPQESVGMEVVSGEGGGRMEVVSGRGGGRMEIVHGEGGGRMEIVSGKEGGRMEVVSGRGGGMENVSEGGGMRVVSREGGGGMEMISGKEGGMEIVRREGGGMEVIHGEGGGGYMGEGAVSVQAGTAIGPTAQGNGQRGGRGKTSGRGRAGGSARIPTTICFGRGSQRAFQHRGGKGRHWHQTQRPDTNTAVDIEKMDFADMADSLVDCN